MTYRPVTAREALDIIAEGGPDVRGMHHQLSATDIWHSYRKHHADSPRPVVHKGNDRQMNNRDLVRLLEVIDEYDYLVFQKRSGNNDASILYFKEFAEGALYVVERTIMTGENKGLRFKTGYAKQPARQESEETKPETQEQQADNPSSNILTGFIYRIYQPGEMINEYPMSNEEYMMA